MSIRHIGFDLDGTLIDTRELIVASIVGCVAPHHRERARERAEARVRESPAAILAEFGVSGLQSYWKLHARMCGHARLFSSHTRATLERLRSHGVTLSVVTSLPAQPANKLLAAAGLRDLFGLVDTYASRRFRKPAPELLEDHLAEIGIDPSQSAYLGDTEGDMQMASRAGAHAWAAGWSEAPRARLREAGAERIIVAIEELIDTAFRH